MDNAKGIKKNQFPKLEKISLEFILNSSDTEAADIEKTIHLAEESFSPVWQVWSHPFARWQDCNCLG